MTRIQNLPAPREVRIIGIGAGSPKHLTLEALEAMREVDVFLVADKGESKRDLVEVREALCREHLQEGSYRFVTLPDPKRGPDADRNAAQYADGVFTWHDARAAAWGRTIAELDASLTVGFLVWGDPAFYDSTIRVVQRIAQEQALHVRVVPGISAFQTLAAAHGIVLHEVGQPMHITTGRRLVEEYSPALGAVIVMLDGHLACRELAVSHPDLTIYWGAYVGMPQQTLRSGRLADVIDEIATTRAALREQHGWVMDVYALMPS